VVRRRAAHARGHEVHVGVGHGRGAGRHHDPRLGRDRPLRRHG
jgi:hypothetical protein